MPEQVSISKFTLDETNVLIEEVSLPSDFAVALMSGRPELLKMIHRPNGLNAQETTQVAYAFAVLFQTNQALRDYVRKINATDDVS